MNVNDRSEKMVMMTGMISPFIVCLGVERLAESMMFAVLPERGATGANGFACPAGIGLTIRRFS
jgi:hypothetical protein